MNMQEPKTEFVAIDFDNGTIATASCGDAATQGGDRCIGDGPHTKCIGCEDVASDIGG